VASRRDLSSLRSRAKRRADNALNNAERVRRYRARQRAKGLCVRCPNPLAEGSTHHCVAHLAKGAETQRAIKRYGLPLALVRELGLNTDRRLDADS
jgi:hypothetical protein